MNLEPYITLSQWPFLWRSGLVKVPVTGGQQLVKGYAEANEEQQLKMLRDTVGGWIEPAAVGKLLGMSIVVYCDEEGKLNGKEANLFATIICRDIWAQKGRKWMSYIVGDVAVLLGREAEKDMR